MIRWSQETLVMLTSLFMLVAQIGLSQYQVNDAAFQQDCNCFRLTGEVAWQSGSVWNVNRIDLNENFDFTFTVNLGNIDQQGADGIAFVLQPIDVDQGTTGGGLGYEGISPSVGVLIDTYQNIGAPNFDPEFDHITIHANGGTNHEIASLNGIGGLSGVLVANANAPLFVAARADQSNIEDGNSHEFRVTWNTGTQTLNVFFEGDLRTSYTGDIVNNVFNGNSEVFWGFTASTGGLFNEQWFCTGTEANFDIDLDPTGICLSDTIQFQDLSETFGTISKVWEWSFGEGIDSIGSDPALYQNPMYSYNQPGEYNVQLIVEDFAGCRDTATLEVNVYEPILAIGPDNEICVGEASTLEIDYQGLYPIDFTFQINGRDTTIQNFNPGNLSLNFNPDSSTEFIAIQGVEVNNSSCLATLDPDTAFVIVNPLPQLVISNDTAICQGETIQLNAIGGNQYEWTQGSATLSSSTVPNPLASPSTTTTYEIEVRNENGCLGRASMTVEVNALPISTITPDQGICLGDSIQLNVNGGTQYEWDSNSLSNTTSSVPWASPRTTTIYGVIITDENGCQNNDSVEIQVYALPNVSAGQDIIRCSGSSAVLSATGADSYNWSPNIGLSGDFQNPLAQLSQTTTYYVTGLDQNGCAGTDSIMFIIQPQSSASISVSGETTACEGNTIVIDTTNMIISGSNPTFEWFISTDGGNTFDRTPATTFPLELQDPADGTQVYLEVTSQDSCSAGPVQSNLLDLTVYPNPEPVLENGDTICEGANTFILANDNSISSNIRYEWFYAADGINFEQISTQNPLPASNEGTYYVEAINEGFCREQSNLFELTVDQVELNAFINSNEIFEGESVILSTSTSEDSILWFTINGDIIYSGRTQNITVKPNDDQIYLVEAGSIACRRSDTVSIDVKPQIQTPNVITPNGDGINDQWIIEGIEDYTECELRVYNRWGNVVFEQSPGYMNDWEGTARNGEDLPLGVYYYRLVLNFRNLEYTGTITVMK